MYEHEPTNNPEHDPATPQPRIWASSLSDYNNGRLHGAWINAAQPAADIWGDITTMLAASAEPDAEEWAIHDYDNFGQLHIGEYESIENISRWATGIVEHGLAYAAWINHHGQHPDTEDFTDHFLGQWSNLNAYVNEFIDDLGIDDMLDQHIPAGLRPYVRFDVDSFARDLELSGDIFTADTPDGDIWIYNAY